MVGSIAKDVISGRCRRVASRLCILMQTFWMFKDADMTCVVVVVDFGFVIATTRQRCELRQFNSIGNF